MLGNLLSRYGTCLIICISINCCLQAQTNEKQLESDAFFIKSLHGEALKTQNSFKILSDLIDYCGGHRLSGTENYDLAVDYFEKVLTDIGFTTTNRQACDVQQWRRGHDDKVYCALADGSMLPLSAVALGNSGHTAGEVVTGMIVEFAHIDSLKNYSGDLGGKVVFFSRPFDQTHLNTFRAYSGAVAQRVFGPNEAAKRGAIATLVRSMSSNLDDHPHTGITIFEEGVIPIPAMAISTLHAERLQRQLKENNVEIGVYSLSQRIGTTQDDNLIGEIKGAEFPEEIILAGAHLDSWDIGKGAHDDGAGCAHVTEAFRLLLSTGYKPKRTWRCVLFANEESGLAGGKEYARISNKNEEFHLAAIESDAGGFTPKSFSFVADQNLDAYMKRVNQFWPLLESYHLSMEFAGSGADIGPLKSQQGLLIGLRPDSQRYFDYHHSTNDNLEHVNPRELSLGAAAVAALIYLIDQHGLN